VQILRSAVGRALDRARAYARFLGDLNAYRSMPGAELVRLRDMSPHVDDRTPATSFDPHYFYQGIWAAQGIARRRPRVHVDVGSEHRWAAQLTVSTQVVFLDIRPLRTDVDGLYGVAGDIVSLPFADRSIPSLSSLHVAEHVGLGRYGDRLDPLGTRRATAELRRVLAAGGDLWFSIPVGRPRVQFNAHRIHSPDDVMGLFADLDLIEFAAVDDAGRFHRSPRPTEFRDARYACGLYWFRRPEDGR
jgi:SAM-dependent methyltransferase